MKTLLPFFTLCLSLNGLTQLTTTTNYSPTALVNEITALNGISIFNVNFSGADSAAGKFIGLYSNVGLDSGIVMTTGTVINDTTTIFGSAGPHGPNNDGSSGTDNSIPGTSLLDSLAGAHTYNAASLEFDFIPYGDSIYMTLVFGSDEYPEFVGGGFNDVFAVLISGPGYSDTTNIALLPGSLGQISIDNINNGPSNSGPCQNCTYYIHNGNGSTAPQNSDPFYIQYDGFTIPVEISAHVICGQEYHMQIAIADAGDGAYDSGIFIKSGSFKSNSETDFALHQNGVDAASIIQIDSASSLIDSLYTDFYIVNNASFDTTFLIKREWLTTSSPWSDAVCFPDSCFAIGSAADWTIPYTEAIFIPAGDSVLMSPIVYTNSISGCAIYKYSILNACDFVATSVQITYSIGGQSCALGAEENVFADTERQLMLFPNPTNDNLILVWKNSVGDFSGNLFNSQGKIVASINSVPSEEPTTINLTQLSNGVYYIVLVDASGKIYTDKVVKQ